MKNLIFAILLSCSAGTALAQVKVSDAWIRGTAPLQEATGAFMKLSSPTDTRLVEAKSPDMRVEIHEMSHHGDVMRMKQIDGIDLPAGTTVELKPGSYHLMIFGVKKQLKEGDTVPLTLRFEHPDKASESVQLQVPVLALGSRGPASHAKQMNPHSGH